MRGPGYDHASPLAQNVYNTDKDVEDETQGPIISAVPRALRGTGKTKKKSALRLSFGPGEVVSGDAAEALEDDEVFTPKSSLSNQKFRKGPSRKGLPALPMRTGEDDGERPTYSKDYLNELKSSTPSTPKPPQNPTIVDEEDVGLDASELDGAMVVDLAADFGGAGTSMIPSEAEIREKKERRQRLAKESDFISLDSGPDHNDFSRQISLLPPKKKAETRLVRDDEDIAEGFDEFVDDGRVSLGKKAERQEKRRKRAEMANMIHEAEGSASSDSDDSEAERNAAYERAQTRKGMDGLAKPASSINDPALNIPSKIAPLPVLSECLERLQATLGAMEMQLMVKKRKMAELEREKATIASREVEIQRLLKEAGDRYSAVRRDAGAQGVDMEGLVEGQMGLPSGLALSRGLESLGNTPTARPQVEDVG